MNGFTSENMQTSDGGEGERGGIIADGTTKEAKIRPKALILYASQTGTAEDLSVQLSDTLERLRMSVTTLPCDSFSSVSLVTSISNASTGYNIVLLIISTTGQGEIPSNGGKFWRNLCRKKLPSDFLAEMQFGVFCLGDSSYPRFCWAGRKLARRLLQLGAAEVIGRGEGDELADGGIDAAFAFWTEKVRELVRDRWSVIDRGLEEIPENVVLPSKWVLEFDGSTEMNGERYSGGFVDGIMHQLHAPRSGGLLATVSQNTRITSQDHFQDVRHISLGLPMPVVWEPGDTISISPKNFSDDVDQFISLQGWEAIADKHLLIRPASHLSANNEIPPPCPISTPTVNPLTLRTLLTHHLDITAIPRRRFFAQAATLTEDVIHKERLQEFADPVWIEELYDYTTRPRRSLLEVLQEFTSVQIPIERLLDVVPRLRERYFSIANCCNALDGDGHGKLGSKNIELLVAIVKYRTVIKKVRQGVCTRYLASLKTMPDKEYKISVVFHKGSLGMKKEDYLKPMIMVAAGTGVAPIRALIQHRQSLLRLDNHGGCSSTAYLFFGCRFRGKDFYFEKEWERMIDYDYDYDNDSDRQNDNKCLLKLFTAFSRESFDGMVGGGVGRGKRYVQTLIREHGKDIWEKVLRPGVAGTVFVCGSSGRMPIDVRNAFLEILREGDEKIAEMYLERMEKEGRYIVESW